MQYELHWFDASSIGPAISFLSVSFIIPHRMYASSSSFLPLCMFRFVEVSQKPKAKSREVHRSQLDSHVMFMVEAASMPQEGLAHTAGLDPVQLCGHDCSLFHGLLVYLVSIFGMPHGRFITFVSSISRVS
jgi:hypothetical protein